MSTLAADHQPGIQSRCSTRSSRYPNFAVRTANTADLDVVCRLTQAVYPVQGGYSLAEVRSQINHFPRGVLVATCHHQVRAYCAAIRLPGRQVFAPHSWAGITGDGCAATHDPQGDYLYGYEICVHPAFRRRGIAKRLYQERFALCTRLGLRGIVLGGRLPGLRRRGSHAGGVERYVAGVVQGRWPDPALSFQLNCGFQVIGLLEQYMPEDAPSLGYASHLLWRTATRPAPREANTASEQAAMPFCRPALDADAPYR